MRTVTMYVDFISPYAWLAFQQLPQALEGVSCHVVYRPVLLGALLKAHHNPGPAGIAPKRAWTQRHVLWLGHHLGVPLRMPTEHPFNPLPLLRLALQCSRDGSINRYVAEQLFTHVWGRGEDALDPARLAGLQTTLAEQLHTDAQAPERAKQLLHSNTQAAQDAGVFGVPTWALEGEIFFGLDSLPMLREAMLAAPGPQR